LDYPQQFFNNTPEPHEHTPEDFFEETLFDIFFLVIFSPSTIN